MINIYDLEFFVNKLVSSAFAIASVEKMVLSGVPFYDDDGDDSAFMDELENESEEETSQNRMKAGARRVRNDTKGFDVGGHNPLKNRLAEIVTEKIAQEKREKMQLVTDLEGIKDKFVSFQSIMTK